MQHSQHLQHLHPHQELQSRCEQHQEAGHQVCQQLDGRNTNQNIHPHHHSIGQQSHQIDHQLQQPQRLSQTSLSTSQDISESCSNSSSSNDIIEIKTDKNDSGKKLSKNRKEESERGRKKKGGKVKGTLETSVEIRNRMIGMSEAGLSTLSIALSINRSVRKFCLSFYQFSILNKNYYEVCISGKNG